MERQKIILRAQWPDLSMICETTVRTFVESSCTVSWVPHRQKTRAFYFCNIFGFCWPTLAAFTVVIRYDLRERMM